MHLMAHRAPLELFLHSCSAAPAQPNPIHSKASTKNSLEPLSKNPKTKQKHTMNMKLHAFQVQPSTTTINPSVHLLKSPTRTRAQFTSPKCLNQPQPNPKLTAEHSTFPKPSKRAPTEDLPTNVPIPKTPENEQTLESLPDAIPRWFLIGGASLGIAFLAMGFDGHKEAMALGPEGPLVEEFWDNMRRYALYALTVSTGMAYTVIQPIVELLKNPITAVLIVIVIAGSGFVVSQVLNAMVGNSDFSYNYN